MTRQPARVACVVGVTCACAIVVGCNGLLGNAEHDVSDASFASPGDDDTSDVDASLLHDASSKHDAAIDSAVAHDSSVSNDANDSIDGAIAIAFDASSTCTGAQTSTVACGHCGSNTRTCGANGTWVDGPCIGEGACAPNATLTCNTSGTQACTAQCTWGPCSCGAGCAPSCATSGDGTTNCGSGSVNCCSTLLVSAGTYARSYDGINFTDNSSKATVTAFRLDRYEVTVGRFRPFVTAMGKGFMPAAGSGKHTHLNLGQGLNATAGGHEPGWDATWNTSLPTTKSAWDTELSKGTWTPAAGSNERLPITSVSWYDAYAFCIWDGGFLPTDAEWNYAAAAGSEQRAYPWSPSFPPGSNAISCGNAWYSGCSSATMPAGAPIPVGSLSPGGDGKWGQADLAGNASEWVLDWDVAYVNPCNDCVNLTPVANTGKSNRGGGVTGGSFQQLTAARGAAAVSTTFQDIGVRCARAM